MQILICGAGQVGYNIAHQLVMEHNDVAIIDNDPALIAKINDSLDVRAHLGHASHPAVLEKAGATDADMLIAVTYSDEVNMVACQIGYSLFNIPTKIARVRHQQYLLPEWMKLYSNDDLALDVIISPEVEVANTVLRRLHTPGTMDVIPFADDALRVVAVRSEEGAAINDLPLNLVHQKFQHLVVHVLGVIKEDRLEVLKPQAMIHAGDEVYFVVATRDMKEVMALFGHEEREARRVVILGGGNVGLYIAENIEKDDTHIMRTKLIEYDKDRANYIANRLQKTTIINGSALDKDILIEAGIDNAETVISVTNDDETNILASLLCKRYGCERSLTLVNNSSYAPLWGDLGIDAAINPRETTVSSILQHVRRGKIRAVYSVANGHAEILEAEVVEGSSVAGKNLEELSLPSDVVVAAMVLRESKKDEAKVIIPDKNTVMQEGSRLIILATADKVRKVEKVFSVSVEYF